MSDQGHELAGTPPHPPSPAEGRPDWPDEYVDRVADRLIANYDLARDVPIAGERFPLYGRLTMTSRKHFFHPALTYGHHDATEHLFATRQDTVHVADLARYVDLGHDLAETWIDADEEHFSTDFTFVVVADSLPQDVRAFVEEFEDRTLIKYGYHGHYEVNLVVVAPEKEQAVASESADVVRAFRLWSSPDEGESTGLIARLLP